MSPYDSLVKQIEEIKGREAVSLVEARNLLLEVEEFISSDDYQALTSDERNTIRLLEKN